jgi:hypothetical protein
MEKNAAIILCVSIIMSGRRWPRGPDPAPIRKTHEIRANPGQGGGMEEEERKREGGERRKKFGPSQS